MNDLGMNLKSLVTFIFAKCETKILATLRSADQQGLDRAARCVCWRYGIAHIEKTRVGYVIYGPRPWRAG